MFVYNFDFKGKKVIFPILSFIFAIICIFAMVSIQSKSFDTATCDEIGEYSLIAEDSKEQCNFLRTFKIEPIENSTQIQNITIPIEFNSIYEEYNSLQKKIGLDLNKYRGKNAKKITYTLKNSKARYAVLLMYEDKIIGAHLTNGEYGQKNMPLI